MITQAQARALAVGTSLSYADPVTGTTYPVTVTVNDGTNLLLIGAQGSVQFILPNNLNGINTLSL